VTSQITLRQRFRRAVRLIAAAAWTVVCYVGWAAGALATIPFRSAARRWNSGTIRTWCTGLLHIFGVRVRLVGHRPAPPFFLVANHLSYLDILVLGATLGATFISKHDIGSWPVIGHLARVTGTIFVNRERRRDAIRVMDTMQRAWQEGAGIVLFPEGTSSRGDQVYPLKSALLEWAVRQQQPVHAAALHYITDDPSHPADIAVCWWGDTGFGPHSARFLTIRRVDATVAFHTETARAEDRNALAALLHTRLTESLAAAERPPS
jgi:1-acyl-sn-glycerol-3-phosphate acyltransferase